VPFIGCGRSPQIEHYRVPKQAVIDQLTGADKAGKDRMLAAIVAHGDLNWFFKLAGQSDQVEQQAENFTALVQSVRFSDQETPKWTLPKGWRERPGDGMRYATLEIESNDGKLEATVTSLPRGEGVDETGYALSNVNRWRHQLGLPPIDKAELDQTATKVDLKSLSQNRQAGGTPAPQGGFEIGSQGATALMVNFEGKLKPGGMGQPPFAGGPGGPLGPTGEPRGAGGPDGPSDPHESAEPTYQVPEGWEALGPAPMRKAAFQVADGDRKAEITISTAGGGLLDNVNRWRGQVMLEPIDEEQLRNDVESIAVGETKGAYFRLIGTERTILGVVAPVAGQIWFIKLAGDNQLAEREREHFEQFVQSIHFREEGAGDGQ